MKKLIIIICLLALALPITAFAKGIPGAVGIWTFDNVKGDTVVDDSGTGNDGEILSGGEIVDGKIGKAIKLNGSNQCVEIQDDDSLDLVDGVTMMCWFYWDGAGDGWQTFFSKGPMSGTNKNYALFINTASGYFHFILTPNGGRLNTDSPNGVIKTEEWQFVAATWDGSDLKIFLDGEYIKEAVVPGDITPNSNTLRLGHREAATHWWMGMLDEMGLFNRALEENELKTIMNDGLVKFMAVDAKGKLPALWGALKTY